MLPFACVVFLQNRLNMPDLSEPYDVVVVGAGHSGCEAALAAARMGRRTLLLTLAMRNVALMPCNPSIGGPAKGHLVREIDALGGEMARNADRTSIQIRMLNTGKGPAVQAPRVQSDKHAYNAVMQGVLARQPRLELREGTVEAIVLTSLRGGPAVAGVRLLDGTVLRCTAIVLSTGTSLNGRLICGERVTSGGRVGEAAALGLSGALRDLGIELGRHKTGTPPELTGAPLTTRLDASRPEALARCSSATRRSVPSSMPKTAISQRLRDCGAILSPCPAPRSSTALLRSGAGSFRAT